MRKQRIQNLEAQVHSIFHATIGGVIFDSQETYQSTLRILEALAKKYKNLELTTKFVEALKNSLLKTSSDYWELYPKSLRLALTLEEVEKEYLLSIAHSVNLDNLEFSVLGKKYYQKEINIELKKLGAE